MSMGQVIKRSVLAPVKRLLKRGKPESRLVAALSPHLPPLVCVDVGASYYPHIRWRPLLESARTQWIAVEPNVANIGYIDNWPWACQVSAVTTGLSEHGGEQTLYVTNVDSGSSLLEPVIAQSVTHRFRNLDYFFPVRQQRIRTLTLGEVIDGAAADLPVFAKLDTQGTELAILRGAQRHIDSRRLVGLETEATLLATPVMSGSGRFWEACQYLEGKGFELIQLKPIAGPSRFAPVPPKGNTFLNECDAVFALRRDVAHESPPSTRAALAGFYLCYNLYEEALSLLEADAPARTVLSEGGCDVEALMVLIRKLA